MAIRSKAYTLLELLVAMTIVVVLAGLLAPVFIQVKEEARKTVCAMNFKQVNLSATLYQIDYDDKYVVSKYLGGQAKNAVIDRTWVQLVQPYLRSLDSTRCPSDHTSRPNEPAVFDSDLVIGNSVERFYLASQRANTGFNFVYLSPMVRDPSGQWFSKPRSTSELQSPAETLVFGDSVWEVDDQGMPSGGGSYLLIPPCRFNSPDRSDSFGLNSVSSDWIYTASKVWDDNQHVSRARSGGLWGWHSRRLTAVMGDGSVKVISRERASDGGQVRQRWGGLITDSSKYLWDLR